MTRNVELTTDAVEEVTHASQWYDDRQDGLGLVFVAAVDRAINHLARWPHAGAPVDDVDPDLDVRTVRVERFPYSLAYVLHESKAIVIAVIHDRRRPRYWIDRLDG
ncbi:MAG: type II toxin-antitoxin system RelE/ParE family toxin [Actinomycetota bacterium]